MKDLKKSNKFKTTTYSISGKKNWYVDVVENNSPEEDARITVWLYNTDYGVKDMMFGVNEEPSKVLEMVKAHVDNYIHGYISKYFDDEMKEER